MMSRALPTQSALAQRAASYARSVMGNFDGSHDWSHIERVLGHAERIVTAPDFAAAATVDLDLVVLGCMLHDVADHKYAAARGMTPDESISHCLAHVAAAGQIDATTLARLGDIMRWTSYSATRDAAKKGIVVPTFVELDVVRDADRLDALGAVGIARASMYGAARGSTLVAPTTPTVAEWCARGSPVYDEDGSVAGHFYAKLLHLEATLATAPAKRMAVPLIGLMEAWVDALVAESRLGLFVAPADE
ncbi:Phosphohydrolase [Pandoravirus salinus]|uniref:Phosphohydrolase n=1 Tax=Pandoravirus salinus TaxID=1349410 RepID=S4W232_9VIRU|nr:Phosphohydrolase [Pandoravirus salinus]AGO84482.1 Phosphohydrolase [Pandoravirus salinus]